MSSQGSQLDPLLHANVLNFFPLKTKNKEIYDDIFYQ